MTKRFIRRTAWFAAIPAVICAAGLTWSLLKPSWINYGGMTAGVTRGQVEVGWGTGQVTRDSNAWVIRGPQGFASILVGPRSSWRPSISSASIGISPGTTSTPLFNLSALYIPLWPLIVLFGGVAALLGWRSRSTAVPGHCRKCGYDLRGIATERCPECGTPQVCLVTRLVRAMQPAASANADGFIPRGVAR